MAGEQKDNYLCKYCNSKTYEDVVKMCLWEEEKLVVIEDIPARVCKNCMEQFYDEATRLRIDKLKDTKFPVEEAKRVVKVPIFSLASVKISEKASPKKPEAGDWWEDYGI